jgi:hypothetical protein
MGGAERHLLIAGLLKLEAKRALLAALRKNGVGSEGNSESDA